MHNRRIQAFTLIELMIVIAIIGILAGVLVPNYMRARAEAKLAACKQNLQNIAKAVELALIRNPDVINGAVYGNGLGAYYIDNQCPLVTEGYLASAPRCPGDGDVYILDIAQRGRYNIVHGSSYTAHSDLDIGGDYPNYICGYGIVSNYAEYSAAF